MMREELDLKRRNTCRKGKRAVKGDPKKCWNRIEAKKKVD